MFGSGEVIDKVVLGHPSLNQVVALLQRNLGNEFLSIAELSHSAGNHLALEEVVRIFGSQAVALGLVGLTSHLTVMVEHVFLHTVELCLSETMLQRAENLGEDHLGGSLNLILLGNTAAYKGITLTTQESAVAGTCLQERSVSLFGQLVETFVEHAAHDVAEDRGTVVAHGALRSFLMFPEQHHAVACSLLVGGNSHKGFLIVGNAVNGTLFGVDGSATLAEEGLHAAFHLIHIKVTHNNHSLHVGTIPVLIKTDNVVAFKTHNHTLQANGKTLSVTRALQHGGPSLVAQTVGSTQVATPLLMNNATLCLNLFGLEKQTATPAIEDVETHLHHGGIVGGHVHIIHRLVEAGVRINATAKLNAVLLQGINHRVAGETLNAIESHVLAEVSQTTLRLILEDRAGIGHHAELDAVLRHLVGTDVVGQAVVQLANTHFLVDRHLSREVALLFALSEHHTANHCQQHE